MLKYGVLRHFSIGLLIMHLSGAVYAKWVKSPWIKLGCIVRKKYPEFSGDMAVAVKR